MKFIKAVILVLFAAATVHAHGVMSAGLFDDRVEWTPIQLGVYPFHLFSDSTDIYGLDLNLLGTNTGSGNVYGLRIAPFNLSESNTNAGITLGIGSVLDYHAGIVISVYSKVERNHGVQIGLVNLCLRSSWRKKQNDGGLQIGLCNQSDSGVQIGLINFNSNSWLPWCPLINWSISSAQDDAYFPEPGKYRPAPMRYIPAE